MRYLFTGDLPTVVGSHSHGRNATVTRANTSAPDVEEIDGSTLIVHHGDVIETDEPIVSAWFKDLDAPDDNAPSPYKKMRKPELIDAAGAYGLDASGSAADLRARLDAFDAEHAPAQAAATNETQNDGTGAEEIQSPQTGADGSEQNLDEIDSSIDDDENAAAATSDTKGDPS